MHDKVILIVQFRTRCVLFLVEMAGLGDQGVERGDAEEGKGAQHDEGVEPPGRGQEKPLIYE